MCYLIVSTSGNMTLETKITNSHLKLLDFHVGRNTGVNWGVTCCLDGRSYDWPLEAESNYTCQQEGSPNLGAERN